MSYINEKTETGSKNILSSAVGLALKTTTISATGVDPDLWGVKTVPAGTIISSSGGTAIGITYQNVDVTDGDHAGSIIVGGRVLKDCLPVAPTETEQTALEARGIIFDESTDTDRGE